MPKYRLRMITLDDYVAERLGIERAEQNWHWRPGKFDLPLAPGPASPRLEVIDFDPANGLTPPPVRLIDARRNNGIVEYDIEHAGEARARETALRQVSLFTTVLRTLDLYENPRALGRSIEWVFGRQPLRLYARSGEGGSPEYDRDDRSLRFPYFKSREHAGKIICTSGSPDIVAHEAAHAIVDAILPELYYSIDPQGLAIHEALADLTAVFISFKMNKPRLQILEGTDGDLTRENEFGLIAEQFGREYFEGRSQNHLRSLFSDVSLSDEWGERIAEETRHHDLSVVMSAAIFEALLAQFEREKTEIEPRTGKPVSTGKALAVASDKVSRIVFRSLDVLPASNVLTFRDLATAMVEVDAYAFPRDKDADVRDALRESFVRRGIAATPDFAPRPFARPDLFADQDLQRLAADPQDTGALIEANRAHFHLGDSGDFDARWLVQEQRIATDDTIRGVRHFVLKVSWTDHEPFQTSAGMYELASQRGTTLVINEATRQVTIHTTNSLLAEDRDGAFQATRTRVGQDFVRGLIDRGVLVDGSQLSSDARAKTAYMTVTDGLLRLHNLGKRLHSD